ncbi:AAA family ATPase [Rosenbergiella sp. S61]|uniref:AAA family ATPase n=1 Tax=Rosenbergiella gaditana TaxID=2726987 RepID=A0ABS5ST83_9GAMM|nr:AAA family ATPase [Rosenbergiella gaditana]MBT0723289.1 AAA family ATPase [Rosenbergiella gaditana]
MSLSLNDLGQRICIIGPSNSGKSTLAKAIAVKNSLPLIHLDQLHHLPDTKWVPREPEDFFQLHEEAIRKERWVIEGNYSKCIPSRLERATGLLLIDIPASTALLRYITRCYSSKPRIGGLTTQREAVTWEMIKHILYHSPKNHVRHRMFFEQATIPKLILVSPREINAYVKSWGLL